MAGQKTGHHGNHNINRISFGYFASLGMMLISTGVGSWACTGAGAELVLLLVSSLDLTITGCWLATSLSNDVRTITGLPSCIPGSIVLDSVMGGNRPLNEEWISLSLAWLSQVVVASFRVDV